MTSLQVRLIICDVEGCPEEFVHPGQYDGSGMVSSGQLRISASRAGWKNTRDKDICPIHPDGIVSMRVLRVAGSRAGKNKLSDIYPIHPEER